MKKTAPDAAISRVTITKDDSRPSRPWCAHLHHSDGSVLRNYACGFKTLKALKDYLIQLFAYTSIPIYDHKGNLH